VEADLRRFYSTTRAALPFRELAWLVRHLPPEAAIFGHGWSVQAMVTADLIRALTGEQHPADPRKKRADEQFATQLEQARQRAKTRRERLGITGSVLRKTG